VPKKDKDVHPIFLMVNQITMGKTTHSRTQHGHATRHKDVNLCSIGGLAFICLTGSTTHKNSMIASWMIGLTIANGLTSSSFLISSVMRKPQCMMTRTAVSSRPL